MKNNNPLVTIVVPVYNVENYLTECLTSLVNQDYENMDVTIRCYLLYQVIDEVLEDTDLLLPANKKFIGDDEDEE